MRLIYEAFTFWPGMGKLAFAAISCFIIAGQALAQDPGPLEKMYSVAEMHKDLDVLNKTLRKTHPRYYAYVSKDRMNALYDSLKAQIVEPMDEFQFRLFVRQAAAWVGCGHIRVNASKEYEEAAKSLKRQLLPLHVWLIGERVFVRSVVGGSEDIGPGAEITGINGRTTRNIMATMKSIAMSDGNNVSHKLRGIEKSFSIYYALCYGFSKQYEVTFKDRTGIIQPGRLLPVEATLLAMPKDSTFGWLIDSKHTRFKIDDSIPTMGILDVDNFSGKKQNQVFRQSFREMRKRKLTCLTLDLRGNPGGNAFRGNNLLRFLLKGPVTRMVFYHRLRPTVFTRHTRAGFMDRLTPFLFATNPIQYPRRGGWAHEFWFPSSCRNRFRGDVYVLTDGGTFSMASYVATYLKHKRAAVIVGEETGGGELGSNGMAALQIVLPHSGIRVGVNTYFVKHAVKTKNLDRGLRVDIPVEYSIKDRLAGRDAVLERVRRERQSPY